MDFSSPSVASGSFPQRNNTKAGEMPMSPTNRAPDSPHSRVRLTPSKARAAGSDAAGVRPPGPRPKKGPRSCRKCSSLLGTFLPKEFLPRQTPTLRTLNYRRQFPLPRLSNPHFPRSEPPNASPDTPNESQKCPVTPRDPF